MKTVEVSKMAYVQPCSETVEVKMHGVLCESNLEGLNPGTEHGWSSISGMDDVNDFLFPM